MFGPYTPTLLALLTRKPKLLKLPTLSPRPADKAAAAAAAAAGISTEQLRELCEGKVAVITGAASGIGAALAKACASYGCHRLVLSDLHWQHPESGSSSATSASNGYSSMADGHPLVRELRALDSRMEVLALTTDVGKHADILAMRDATLGAFGAPHFLFNNAGVGMPGVLSASDEALHKSLDVNLMSVLHGMRAFVGPMESLGDDQECHIVNTASLAGISESTGLYGLTKHAVVAATESVASELAWRRSNVRVSVLCPSYVQSNVIATTARFAASNNSEPSIGDSKLEERPALTEAEKEEINSELAGLAALVGAGMEANEVADRTLQGLVQGKRYIYTSDEHTEAALGDRVRQLQAGGLPDGFNRYMEKVVESALRA